MIEFTDVTLTYDTLPVLSHVTLEVPEATLCLVSGPTGSGKTSLLGMINGLVPRFTGGVVEGSVTVAGRSIAEHPPSALADLVGHVPQSPDRGFVAERVETELAFGMEQHGIPAPAMRARVEETLDLLGLAGLRDRRLSELSGGEQQRVAIGAVLTMGPSVLVLDEPTSALDPAAAEEVLAILHRMVHDLGMTVVLSEHRLERVVQYADMMVAIGHGGVAWSGSPRDVLAAADLAPPVVELGRRLGWVPLPLTVREARLRLDRRPEVKDLPRSSSRGAEITAARGISVAYGPTIALRAVDFSLCRGEVCVVMGRNGSGKSSLFRALHGTRRPDRGTVTGDGRVGLVPQNPADLLYLPTVEAECRQADRDADRPDGSCRELFERFAPDIDRSAHPSDLSEGQKLALVLAIQLVSDPDVVLLDEPTRGLDYPAKARLATTVRELAASGSAVALSTHDVEFAAIVADRVVVLAEGEVITDGPAVDVLTATPLFSPQAAKVCAPVPILTVDHAVAALGATS